MLDLVSVTFSLFQANTLIDVMTKIEELTVQGVIARPRGPERPKASGRELPRADQSLSELIAEQRR